MKTILVNLKRFEVAKALGGLCPTDDPVAWVESVIARTAELGLGAREDIRLVYLLPEALVPPAARALAAAPPQAKKNLAVGCQGVHWDDIAPGKNFGAFTSLQPATAVRHLGATWAIVGHSEERKAFQQVMLAFDPTLPQDAVRRERAARAVDGLVNGEALAALRAGLNALICVGESADERGEGTFEEQKPRIEQVLSAQIKTALKGTAEAKGERQFVIGYEPIWAIGPGKVPPGRDYIAFVSALIRDAAQREYGLDAPVVYGGGLKEENAAMIASIPTIAGGLVGLTRFIGEIGFDVEGLAGIISKYTAA